VQLCNVILAARPLLQVVAGGGLGISKALIMQALRSRDPTARKSRLPTSPACRRPKELS
jgi:hypothetical protein